MTLTHHITSHHITTPLFTTSSAFSPHTKKVIPPLLTSRNLLPPQTRHIDNTHTLDIAPIRLFRKPTPQLLFVDVFTPLMRPLGHNTQNILCNHVRNNPARPRPRNRAHYQPAARLYMWEDVFEERTWRVYVLDYFEQRDDVEGFCVSFGTR